MARVAGTSSYEPPGTVVEVAGVPSVLLGSTRTASTQTFALTISGAVTVQTGTARFYNDTGRSLIINVVRGAAGTPPTGSALILEIKKNGVPITDPTNRLTLPSGATTATSTVFTHPIWNNGEYLTVDVLQVGSTVPGSMLVVSVQASAGVAAAGGYDAASETARALAAEAALRASIASGGGGLGAPIYTGTSDPGTYTTPYFFLNTSNNLLYYVIASVPAGISLGKFAGYALAGSTF